MEYEIFCGIKKQKVKVMRKLFDRYLKWSWFLCYQITQDVSTAAPLLISAWEKTVQQILQSSSNPNENFKEILFIEILKLSLNDQTPDQQYETLPEPKVSHKYRIFVKQICSIPKRERSVYLLNVYGGINLKNIASVLEVELNEIEKIIKDTREAMTADNTFSANNQWAANVQLFAEFRNPTGSGFDEIVIPELLQINLDQKLKIPSKVAGSSPKNSTKTKHDAPNGNHSNIFKKLLSRKK